MKVIVAGMPKTGTKSMNAALTKLGYSVYDFPENFFILGDDYSKILNDGWTVDDFRRMYENVDAVVDIPAFFFWDEIHRAFPDAKIILTIRDEEEWLRSFTKQMKNDDDRFMHNLIRYLSPTGWKATAVRDKMMHIMFGYSPSPFKKWKLNGPLAKKLYRTHNAYVQQVAPKEKLLVYKCSDGWGPLCKFLDIPVPDEPFPHKNKDASFAKEFAKYPVVVKMKNEVLISSVLLVTAAAATMFAIQKYGFSGIWTGFHSAMNRFRQFF